MKDTRKLTLSALFLALGLVLPFLTMQVPEIGNMLLPMHFPVLICGFICGWKYGLTVGFIVPILRSMLWGMPVMPKAIPMAFEIAAYGLVAGLLYYALKKHKFAAYISLIASIIAGRIVWGVVSFIAYQLLGNSFTWEIFVAGAFLDAIPGIILQLILIPPIITILQKVNYLNN